MDQIEVAGLRIAYERVGAGPALVFLHGYVGDGPTLWRRQLEALCDEITVVVWDAPGVGGSSDPPESFGAALPHINVATLLVYGGEDVRAPLTVAHDLEAAISGSRLVVLPDAGHLCNVEAPDEFNTAVRGFLRSQGHAADQG